MTALKISSITSTLAAATCISLEWAIPRAILSDISDHVFGLIVPSETVLAVLFPISKDQRYSRSRNLPTCMCPLDSFCSIRIPTRASCTNDKMLSDI
jgi:hypothetical protein